jgi:S-adenosyl-L-methionine hydrolase (adenosine-forming)
MKVMYQYPKVHIDHRLVWRTIGGMIPTITFISDFGLKDAYVAQVKAVMLTQAPEARIIDITHDIDAFDIISAGWLLATSFRFFSAGTIHLAVVDPGVGTGRGILYVKKDGHIFVGPDNGVFSFLFPAETVIEITWRPQGAVSSTFHGRDIFAMLVARILAGDDIHELGTPAVAPVSLEVKDPMVVHIDTFGNVITNILCESAKPEISLELNGQVITVCAKTFADIPSGSLGLICGSASTVEIVTNRGNAAKIIGAKAGMPVKIR